MTSEDHNTDAFIAALRSPALPAEQIGEAAALTLMVEARAAAPATLHGVRSRRGVAIAAVTVASLGLGGLVAAGPGIFSPAADRSEVTAPPSTDDESSDQGEPSDDVLSTTSLENTAVVNPVTEGIDIVVDADVLCADGNHGRTVSSIARAGDSDTDVADAARSDCGKPDRAPSGANEGIDDDVDDDIECAAGNHGATVSSVAQSDEADGQAVAEAAGSNCGKPDQAGGSNRPDDAGQPADAGKPDDAGKPADAGQPADAGKPDDAGQPADAGKPADAGQPADAGKPDDAGQPADAGKPADAGNDQDSGKNKP